MARRKKKPAAPATWIEWSAEIAALFQLVPDTYTPPRNVRGCAARGHLTYTAMFTAPDGQKVKATTRIQKDGGGWFIKDQGLVFSFSVGGRAA